MTSSLAEASATLAAARRLRRLQAALATGEPLPPEDAAIIAGALGRYLEAAPAGLDLDAALGIATAPGGEAWWRTERRAARDELLRQVAADLPGSTSARAHALAERLRRYDGTGWPHDRRRGTPMPDTPERRALFRLFDLDPMPPMGVRRLIEILSS